MTGFTTMYIPLRQHLLTPLAIGLLMACSSDAPGDDGGGTGRGVEMLFSANGAAATTSRAAATTDLKIQGSTFAVFGDRKSDSPSGDVIFSGDKVSYDATKDKWNYANPRYWLPDQEHSFVALHPADPTGISNTTYSGSRLSFDITLPADYRSTPDLLVAAHRRMYEELSTPFVEDPEATVRFGFNHAMSRINFMVKADGAAEVVKIKKIELEGVNRAASLAITPAPLSAGGDRTDDCNLYWTGISDKGDIVAEIDVDVPDQQEHPLFPDGNALFMIPQPDNNEVITRITYELYDGGVKADDDYTLIAQEPIGGWRPGKMYTYSLTVTSLQQPVNMTVSISDWLMGADNNVTVPRK